MREWMQPGSATDCAVELKPRVGGEFTIITMLPDVEVVNRGEIVTLERPSKLQFTWLSSRWGNQETRVTLGLEPADTQWQLVLTHERFPVEHSSGQLTAGWNQMVEKLAGVLDRNLLRVICQVK